jgi:fructokinase
VFAVVGEAVVDLVERDDGAFTAHPGGSPVNVAVALARLGHKTTLHARLSRGGFGRRLREHIQANGVDLRHAVDAREPATLAAVTLDAAGAASYEFYVAGTADWRWTGAELAAVGDGAQVVHTGSLACLMPPGRTELLARLERLRQAGDTLISYDPNIRPGLLDDAVRDQVERYVRTAHIVKASQEDLTWLYPELEYEAAAARWRASGPALVVVTRGGDGAYALTTTGAIHRPAETVEVVDTIGAGDAFTAGLLAALADLDLTRPESVRGLSRTDVSSVLQHAGLVAALTCTRAGADPPHLHAGLSPRGGRPEVRTVPA